MRLKTTKKADYSAEVKRQKYETEQYFLRRKTTFVNSILVVLLLPIVIALYNYGAPLIDIFIYIFFFVLIFIMNFIFYQYPKVFTNLKLPMYITALALYIVAISLIIDIQSTSVFTVLFLVYAIVSLYQDKTTAFINNISLLFIGTFIVFRYPNMFITLGETASQLIYIYVILIIFVALLSISSFILIKRKMFFYEKISKIKEIEIRTINIVIELKRLYSRSKFDFNDYYNQIDGFFDKLSEEINIENVFKEKIQLIKDLEHLDVDEILTRYPEANIHKIEELKRLELKIHSKMHYLMYQSAQTYNLDIEKRDLFTDNQFPSLKHTFDNKYTKIIAFSVFYTMLKIEKPYLKALDGKTIRKLLLQDDYYHIIDSDVADIYFNNSKIFDKIAEDSLKEKVTANE